MPAVLITGGAKRIGAKIAERFAESGFDIALHYNRSEKEALALRQVITGMGKACELLQADLSYINALDGLMAQAKDIFPELTALVNNASVFEGDRLIESDYANYQEQFRVNTEAPIFLTQAFAKHVGKGCVVNMLDMQVAKHKHRYFFYLLSKKTLAAFTQMAALELGPDIRVNGICPGYILPGGDWGDEYGDKLASRLPLRKIAQLDEVADAVYSLAVNTAITGQCLFLDGGEFLL